MKVFKFFPPYQKSGKTTFPETKNRAGVYLIKEDGILVYIGSSMKNGGNLYKTLYRHFEAWHHRGQEVLTYKNKMKRHKYTVRVILCTPGQAERLEKALIKKYKPRDNGNLYEQVELIYDDKMTMKQYLESRIEEEAPF